MIRRAMTLLALAACTSSARTDAPAQAEAPAAPPCAVPAVDTAGWRPLTAQHRTLAITLPPSAREVALPCYDSPCGRILVGAMVLSYDSGPMAGPGTQLATLPGSVLERSCGVDTREGRHLRVGIGRYVATTPWFEPRVGAPDTVRAGSVTAQAVMRISEEGGGMYLYMHSPRAEDLGVFLAALPSVRVLRIVRAP